MAYYNLDFNHFSSQVAKARYLGNRTWRQLVKNLIDSVIHFNSDTEKIWTKNEIKFLEECLLYKWFIPGGRYLYYSDKKRNFYNNCFLMGNIEDTREGWSKTLYDNVAALMTGGGIGWDYSNIRPSGSKLSSTGGESSGPIPLMEMNNDSARGVIQGGSRRSALYGSLHWKHADIFNFIKSKNWSPIFKKLKEESYFNPAPLDFTNISVRLDKEFWNVLDRNDPHAKKVWEMTIVNMLQTSEPGFQNDWDDQIYRNACTEIISADPFDVCNLGSVNIARLDNKSEFEKVLNVATKFLYCGSIAGELPLPEMYEIRNKNRRLGVGLMGVHEWLLKRGMKYEWNAKFKSWMESYKEVTDTVAEECSKKTGLNKPIATRAFAPNGTIGILGETTTGIEPIFATAYKRKWLKNNKERVYEYVIDATVKRLLDDQYINDPDKIEDAMDLAKNPKKRIEFQWQVQKYVDQSISSTINLPNFNKMSVEEQQEMIIMFKSLFRQYLPELRGITVYSDQSRGGQPLEKVSYYIAKDFEGAEISETSGISCKSGTCGS